jgi:DNA ligase-1
MIPIRYDRGLEIPEHGLWLDPWDGKPLAFVSHAHSDHIANHREIIATPATARLMRARLGAMREEHLLEFGERTRFRDFDLTLLSAGHILGSAQALLESEHGSLLYTGDFKLRPGLAAEPAQWGHAETLVMETTYGLPKYRLPPTAEVVAQMVAFCQDALEDGAVPVLLGYSLGKSQEILCALLEAGLTPMLHGAVFQMTEVYRELKPDFPTGYVRYDAADVAGKVLLCPPSANRTLMIRRIKNRRTAVLTGWALDQGAAYRYQCDAAFPLSDHADYTDLVRYVELVAPQRVLTLHGFAAAFAADLRQRGIEAWALSQENQLEFELLAPKASPQAPPRKEPGAMQTDISASGFSAFAALGEQIAGTTSRLKKTGLLGAYLRGLDTADLPLAARYLTGRVFVQNDPRTLQTGWAVIRRALLAATGVGEQELRALSRRHADAGKTAYEALLERTSPEPFSLADSALFFDQLQRARGPVAKTEWMTQRLATVTALEGSYIVRILTGDLRIGLKEGMVAEAIAAAFDVSNEDVRRAHMLLGDMGETALLASQNKLGSATLRLFHPVQCMLASPEATATDAWERLAANPHGIDAWAEDKFDGIRAQLHAGEGRAEIYTRDLHCVTGQFAELVRGGRTLERAMILDGEIFAQGQERKLTFFDLQKRLGRSTEDDLFLEVNDVPVTFKAFDLLSLDGASLLGVPLERRRALLESLPLPASWEIIPKLEVKTIEELETAFEAARDRGNEGLIIKDRQSLYTPGRRGMAWLKLKRAAATLDVVVVGAEGGHGKRSHVLSDYTFAVRDEATGALLTIGKAYSGLTDEEIEELTAHFTNTTLAQRGRYREVRPEIVLEIAFDSVQASSRHSSGLALRFPRIKAWRRDKAPGQIDTLGYARGLANAGAGSRNSRADVPE